jgi:hypothetical protein
MEQLNVFGKDILSEIIQYLSVESIVQFYSTCKKLKSLLDSENTWKALYFREFGKTDVNMVEWKKKFINESMKIRIEADFKFVGETGEIRLICKSLKNQSVNFPVEQIAMKNLVKRANQEFLKPQDTDNVISFFCKISGPKISERLFPKCCDKCGKFPIYVRTFGCKFDNNGVAKVHCQFTCTPSHDGRGFKNTIFLIACLKRQEKTIFQSDPWPLVFKSSKRKNEEIQKLKKRIKN